MSGKAPLLPFQPQDAEGPVFREPWEAQAFALALSLHEKGVFTWTEWAAALSDEIKAAQATGDADVGDTYYHHWLRALERLAAEKATVTPEELEDRKEDWRRAYLNTPHGKPVTLSAAE